MLDLEVQMFTLLAGLAVMVGTWSVSVPMRDASLADIAWGLSFIAIAWTAHIVGEGEGGRSLLIAILITVWGLRLAGYIAWRHDGEDKRYAKMREKAGEPAFFVRSLFTVFIMQALIAWVVAAPVQVAATDPTPPSLGALAVIGAIVWLVGFCFESIGDFQLQRFLANRDSGDEVLSSGLWRYTRHPNYFGDALGWFGIWLIALESGSAWWTVIGPVVMTVFLVKVSGVAMTEKNIADRRPAYREYIEKTSTFIPMPPKG
ncbi:MAG: DUF1295 domain-containing protein [Solirubrobacterales bacterium]